MARARLARGCRKIGWQGLVAGSALALAVGAAGAAAQPAEAAATGVGTAAGAGAATGVGTAAGAGGAGKAAGQSAAACGKAVGPFRVSGTQVLGAGGKPFVSYGLTVAGLQSPYWASSAAMDRAEITATADQWCANTVRLQLDQDDLLGPDGTGFSPAYLAAIESEVSLAESYHLVVVLNDETNLATPAEQKVQRGPTPGTETFWKDLAAVYGNDPQVIFDLFNEPRMYSPGMPLAQEWRLWLDGGTFDGVYYPFGMAQLAAYVRTTAGARNLFWIEGPNFSASFAGMVQEHALLHVSGVVYAVHHPAGPADAGSWSDDFGYLITTGVAPVVEGEWTNYEPAPTAGPAKTPTSCWPNAPAMVPAFLQYLTLYSVGLNAYTLQPGFMIKSYSNLAGPTTINPATWTCQSDSERQPGQGAGSAVLAWFQQQNG
jgi:Cellulase (glycosyl hydrolase family 5)